MDIDRAEELYGLPPDVFVAARNALAKQLKEEGKTDEAKTVRALKKPSLSVWTVNQLAKRSRDKLEELLRVRDEIEEAASAKELRSRTEDRRRVLGSLLSDARRILEEAGNSASAPTVDKVAQTLLAIDDHARDALLAGTLAEDLTSTMTSIGGFAMTDSASTEFGTEDEEIEEEKPDPEIERLQEQLSNAELELEESVQVAERTAAAAAEARERADAARERVQEIRQELHAKQRQQRS